jgi:sugar phosphate isomerase/epimerase
VLARARRLGAAAIRIFTGNHRSADADAEQWARAVACLQELADAAAPYGIKLAAEVHDWNLMDTVDGCLRLIDRIARPNFGFIYHPTHFAADPIAPLAQLGRHVLHVHATNVDGDLEHGRVRWTEVVAALRGHGFAGYLSVEWFRADPDGVAQREVAYLRRLIAG